jgi:ribosomal protein L37AE/L43A
MKQKTAYICEVCGKTSLEQLEIFECEQKHRVEDFLVKASSYLPVKEGHEVVYSQLNKN